MKRLSAVLISSLMSPHISAAPLFQYDAEQQFLNQQQRQKAQEEQLTPVVPDVRLSPELPPRFSNNGLPG